MRIWKYQQIIPLPLSNTLLNLSRSRFSPAHPQTWHHPVAFSFRKILVILLKPLIFPLLPAFILTFWSYLIQYRYSLLDARCSKSCRCAAVMNGMQEDIYFLSLFLSHFLFFSSLSLSLFLSFIYSLTLKCFLARGTPIKLQSDDDKSFAITRAFASGNSVNEARKFREWSCVAQICFFVILKIHMS